MRPHRRILHECSDSAVTPCGRTLSVNPVSLVLEINTELLKSSGLLLRRCNAGQDESSRALRKYVCAVQALEEAVAMYRSERDCND